MKFVKTGIGILVVTLVFAACKNVDYQKTKNGVPYKIIASTNDKDTAKIRKGSFVKYQFLMTLKKGTNDSVMNSSYTTMPGYQQVDSVRASGNDIPDAINEVLLKTEKGDSVYMTFSADSLILRNPAIVQRMPFLVKGQSIVVSMRVLDVFTEENLVQEDFKKERAANSTRIEAEEIKNFEKSPEVQAQMPTDTKIIEDYLKANNIKTERTPWGAYVQVIEPGTGPKPTFGKYVNVKYNGMNLSGQSFDSGNYPIQMGMGGSIKGFEEGVRNLGTGGKARVFVPSMLGYGPQGSPPKIQPNQVLMFDVEVLSIGDTSPQMLPAVPDTATKKK